MDLKAELLNALDNPEQIWETMLGNFPDHTRLAAIVFATCSTPVLLTDWQHAVVQVNQLASTRFEDALRTLDDNFVNVRRVVAETGFEATFRNPSIDDFCAAYLERNTGIVISILRSNPSMQQLDRMIKLGTAKSIDGTQGRRYPNLAHAITARPGPTSEALVALAERREPLGQRVELAGMLLDLHAFWSPTDRANALDVTGAIVDILRIAFTENDWGALYQIVDVAERAAALPLIVGAEFDQWYESLAASAASLGHYDSLVNLDVATGRSGEDASWADGFETFADDELNSLNDLDEAQTGRDYYSKVADHLSLDPRVEDWDELVFSLSTEDDEHRERDYRGYGQVRSRILDHSQHEKELIDGMFNGLVER